MKNPVREWAINQGKENSESMHVTLVEIRRLEKKLEVERQHFETLRKTNSYLMEFVASAPEDVE